MTFSGQNFFFGGGGRGWGGRVKCSRMFHEWFKNITDCQGTVLGKFLIFLKIKTITNFQELIS